MVQIPGTAGSNMRASPATSTTNSTINAARGKPTINGNGYHPSQANVHLSAMQSSPLDLLSVERRGQPTASREPTKKMRPHGLQEAPTYRPTEEEFKDPFAYIKKISPEASKYGMCKIIPPETWNPDFAIDTEHFHFRTRKQELNSVEGSTSTSPTSARRKCDGLDRCPDTTTGTRANLTYLDQLQRFHKQNGTNLNRFPSVDKRPLDLYKLRKAVETRGGFEKVCKLKKWAEIGRDLGYSGKIMSSLSTSLKNSYQRWLHPFEEYLRLAKPGVHQQLEFEYGGPLTPSPANSPIRRSTQNTPASVRGDSPAIRASEALNASLRDTDSETKTPGRDSPAPSGLSSGFTAVSNGNFTPVNSSSTAGNNGQRREREGERGFTPRRSLETPLTSAKNTPEYRPSALGGTPLTTNDSTPNPLKRCLSRDSTDSRKENLPVGEDDSGERRSSKRLKKDAVPTVAGSHMTLFKPSTPKLPRDGDSVSPDERCENCGKADDPASILICENCEHAYHMRCLDPPVLQRPDYDWNCPRCLVGDGQFGFEEGGIYSLKQFQEKAAEFKEKYFENKMPFDPVLNCARPVTEDDIEREFWRLVASLEETVEVEYGADIHSTTHGSGFPTLEKCPKDPYSTDPWNLNIMPLHADSLFRHIKSDISGMTVPWLYVGMIFSTFCWHNEDHYSYSANYQHFGSTKTWYGIPGEDAEKFEAAMREAVPELFETQPDLLFQLVTLLPPEQLKKAGVRVYALDQRAGQFVITYPQAYHAGFNHGFNFNEAVNFAPSDWEPFGDVSIERLQQFRRQPCFSHDELLWTAAEGAATGGVTIQTAKWLAPALERMRDRELEQRKYFLSRHNINQHTCRITETDNEATKDCEIEFVVDEEDVAEEEYVCAHCKTYTYLSRFTCQKTGKVLCLIHAGNYECCKDTEDQRFSGHEHILHYRRTEEEIVAMYQRVVDKAQVPEQWEEKVEKALQEEATPQLKVLRGLINEGERIPYDLPSLPNLKAFVDRCNEWVEEATNYIVRKQQNRRKEKAWRKGSKTAEMEERDRESRKAENVLKLLKEAEQLGFDCPEITQLKDRADAISEFQRDAKEALDSSHLKTTQELEELIDVGRTYNIDMPELDKLERLVQQMKWIDDAKAKRGVFISLHETSELIAEGERLGVPADNEQLVFFRDQKDAAEAWESKAKELMSAELINYSQLEGLSHQVQSLMLPVTAETLTSVDQILNKQREAWKQVRHLYFRCRAPDYQNRPKYSEVRELMEHITELNSKPSGTLDLEKEQKRHEDWMRKGKKLFGKANAPLHILKSHMEYVLERNLDCFDITIDKPRLPAEPASREPSPTSQRLHSWEDPRFREVFCICRKVEAGMMIECELCHEWYHGKCLKIARGKVKEDEKYTCPICDWRVKIPRDAARPKLEDLQAWQDEIQKLPFKPDEEEVLDKIINNAQEFRNHVMPFCNPLMATSEEAETQRFYLRKIEGAEILLSYETNFFRQELHRWSPVAPEPPPVLEVSKSTRKPRPTKLQKLMAQHGVDDPEDLPQSLRTKQHHFKRKSTDNGTSRPQPLQPAPGRSASGTPTNASFPTPNQLTLGQNGPTLSGTPDQPQQHPAFTYDSNYGMSDSHGSTPSVFTPQALQRSMMSPTIGASISPRAAALIDPSLFNGGTPYNRNGQGPLDSPNREGFNGPALESSQPSVNIDNMFRDLTNQDEDASQPNTSQSKDREVNGSKDNQIAPSPSGSKVNPQFAEPDSPLFVERPNKEKSSGPWEEDTTILFEGP